MRVKYYALWLCLICIIVFVFQNIFSGFTDLFILDKSLYFQVWRFLTSIFLHGSLAHLISNMFALALFGTILESFIGSRRFLLVFFTSGIFANLIAVNFYDSSLGASGAIYGVLGALVIIKPMMTAWVYGLPMPMFIAGLVWVAGGIVGIFAPSNVGHIAHLSGIAVGFIFGFVYRKKAERMMKDRIVFDESSVKRWEDYHIRKARY